MQIFHQGFLGGEILWGRSTAWRNTANFLTAAPLTFALVTLRSNPSRTPIMNFASESWLGPLYSAGSRSPLLTGAREMCLTWVNISCSCSSMSLLADPSDLCSSMREKCSMLLMDSFSCRVKITSWNTERWSGWEVKLFNAPRRLQRHSSCAGK